MVRRTYETLLDAAAAMTVIDAHEHLVCESDRLAHDVDILMLLHLYEYVDMTSAGYKQRPGESVFANNLCLDTAVPLETRWAAFRPYLQQIKHGSYYQPLKIALNDLYQIDDLDDQTYHLATEKIRAANKKGLYHSIMRDRCRIETALVQNGRLDGQDPADLFVPLFSSPNCYDFSSLEFVKRLSAEQNVPIHDFQTYLDLLGLFLEDAKKKGAVGFKMAAGYFPAPDRAIADRSFAEVLKGGKADRVLMGTTLDYIFSKCAALDWVVAVHCGVWWDYRTVDSKPMIDLVQRYPQVRFDLYHLGFPFVRDTIFIAKNFPNAYLNLCWAYIVDQTATEQAINEIVDAVPVNKIIAFGADCCWAVESVYGHLAIARQTLAAALAARIDKGRLNIDGAKHILNRWLYTNPKSIYRLGVNV